MCDRRISTRFCVKEHELKPTKSGLGARHLFTVSYTLTRSTFVKCVESSRPGPNCSFTDLDGWIQSRSGGRVKKWTGKMPSFTQSHRRSCLIGLTVVSKPFVGQFQGFASDRFSSSHSLSIRQQDINWGSSKILLGLIQGWVIVADQNHLNTPLSTWRSNFLWISEICL